MNKHILVGATLLASLPMIASASSVDLTTWVGNEGNGTWTIQPGNDSVVQSINGDPTVFYSGGNAQGSSLSGEITVNTSGDDDYIGFVLGYHAGDLSNAAADYLVIDWKQGDQGAALDGLAISRVTGAIANGAGAWGHDAANGFEELARGTNLGSTGWNDYQTYDFDITFTSSLVEVYVDSVLEISLAGSFNDGSFGFYNYSQSNVEYSSLVAAALPPVPLPATLPLLLAGLGGFGLMRRKR